MADPEFQLSKQSFPWRNSIESGGGLPVYRSAAISGGIPLYPAITGSDCVPGRKLPKKPPEQMVRTSPEKAKNVYNHCRDSAEKREKLWVVPAANVLLAVQRARVTASHSTPGTLAFLHAGAYHA